MSTLYQVKGDHQIIISGDHFNLAQTFECGQCFRWQKTVFGGQDASSRLEPESKTGLGLLFSKSDAERVVYSGMVGDKFLSLWQNCHALVLQTTEEDFLSVWQPYFDLDTDYASIIKTLSLNDPVLRKAAAFGQGIRILRQDPWEMLMTFILSSNNNIPRITGTIEVLSQRFGKPSGEMAHGSMPLRAFRTFPDPEALASAGPEAFREAGAGYRDKFLHAVSVRVASGALSLTELASLEDDVLRKQLMALPGVGEKVADCVMLFGFGRRSCFPVDTWVKRIMQLAYFDHEVSIKEINTFARDHFGPYAGYAQQYLFYLVRTKGLEAFSL